jgi:hypothetical protein
MTRPWLLAAGLLSACSTQTPANTGSVTVSGVLHKQVVYTGGCGGVAPPPGTSRPTPSVTIQPWAAQSLAIRAGTENSESAILATAVTDSAGAFTVALDPGPWCVLLDGAKKNPEPKGKTVQGKTPSDFWTDMDCMRAKWRQCDAVLQVPGPASVTITIAAGGSGCHAECEHGPSPP